MEIRLNSAYFIPEYVQFSLDVSFIHCFYYDTERLYNVYMMFIYNVYMMFIYNVYIIVSVVNLRTSGISIIKCGLVNWMRRRAWCYINGYINRYLKVSRLYSIFISGLKCTSWC